MRVPLGSAVAGNVYDPSGFRMAVEGVWLVTVGVAQAVTASVARAHGQNRLSWIIRITARSSREPPRHGSRALGVGEDQARIERSTPRRRRSRAREPRLDG